MRTVRCSGRLGEVCVDRILDTRLWKHYLSATTADGKNTLLFVSLARLLISTEEPFFDGQQVCENIRMQNGITAQKSKKYTGSNQTFWI